MCVGRFCQEQLVAVPSLYEYGVYADINSGIVGPQSHAGGARLRCLGNTSHAEWLFRR